MVQTPSAYCNTGRHDIWSKYLNHHIFGGRLVLASWYFWSYSFKKCHKLRKTKSTRISTKHKVSSSWITDSNISAEASAERVLLGEGETAFSCHFLRLPKMEWAYFPSPRSLHIHIQSNQTVYGRRIIYSTGCFFKHFCYASINRRRSKERFTCKTFLSWCVHWNGRSFMW